MIFILFELICKCMNNIKLECTNLLPINEKIFLIGGEKEFFFVFDKRLEKKYILSPELTFSAFYTMLQEKIYFDGRKIFYYGRCFRNERKQKNRYKQFNQIGVEYLHSNKAKVRINTLIHIVFISFFYSIFDFKQNEIKIIINCDEYYSEIFKKYFENNKIMLEIDQDTLKKGNENSPYIGISYDLCLYDKNSNKYIEVAGGGEYFHKIVNEIKYGTGFAIGEKRSENYLKNVNDFEKNIYLYINKISNNNLNNNERKKIGILMNKKSKEIVQQMFLINKFISDCSNINFEILKNEKDKLGKCCFTIF